MSRTKSKRAATPLAILPDEEDRTRFVPSTEQLSTKTTEDKVHPALAAIPGSTTAQLAMAAGVGRSTAAKILARWAREGTVIRTAGDGPRIPDTWALAAPDGSAAAANTGDPLADTLLALDDPAEPADDALDDTVHALGTAEEATTDVDDTTIDDTTAAQEITAGSEAAETGPESAATAATSDESAPSAETDDTDPLPDASPIHPMDGVTEPEPSPAELPAVAAITASARAGKDRLPKGGLRALVEEYLTNHPGQNFGPGKIATDLTRSSGAVNNACEKLVADGYAIKTCEAPKRFAINPDKTDVLDAAG
ncbi:hypothetical protein [Amycolatopsis sp. PS_44_ISF1]|uniref:hypothetical protein n=1 Tax=Amycolatopsis sp. PS_44_ISF1 TaxID=2974917 RepID=UPI0028DE7DD4|nr:hypothetical protein [Amycolatopsis sp. PS_44_ISF1]MDT8916057.1 hypothetical protein [Amycolatopsis sp. PS_44_ISF1]